VAALSALRVCGNGTQPKYPGETVGWQNNLKMCLFLPETKKIRKLNGTTEN